MHISFHATCLYKLFIFIKCHIFVQWKALIVNQFLFSYDYFVSTRITETSNGQFFSSFIDDNSMFNAFIDAICRYLKIQLRRCCLEGA